MRLSSALSRLKPSKGDRASIRAHRQQLQVQCLQVHVLHDDANVGPNTVPVRAICKHEKAVANDIASDQAVIRMETAREGVRDYAQSKE